MQCLSVLNSPYWPLSVYPFLDEFFKNPTFKIAISGRAGSLRWASYEVYRLVNLFEKKNNKKKTQKKNTHTHTHTKRP